MVIFQKKKKKKKKNSIKKLHTLHLAKSLILQAPKEIISFGAWKIRLEPKQYQTNL